MNITTEEALAIGGSEWTSRDGKVHRVYLSICDLMGVEVERYRSGNVSHAEMNGEDISNAEAMRIMGVKVFVAGGELVITGAESVRSFTAADVEAAVVARLAEIKPDETEVEEDIVTVDYAAKQLASEGYDPDDIDAAINSLIKAGLEAEQPDHTVILTMGEVGLLRRQLDGTDA
jgi:hypothetical protein